MTRVLDRYVYREMLPVFLLGAGMFTFLHVMDRLQDFSNMAVGGTPIHLVLRLWALLLLSFLSHTLPMGLLLAVTTAAGRLTSDLEVVALHASGVGPLRLFRPFLVAALAVAVMMAGLTLWINPWGSAAFFRHLRELQQNAVTPLIQERAFTRIGDLVIYVEEAALATSELRGVLIADEREPRIVRIITAPRGRLLGDATHQRTVLRLADGAVHESSLTSPDWYRVTGFSVYDTSLDVGAQINALREERGREKDWNTWDLISNTRALEMTREVEKAEMFVTEFHKRLTFPLAPIVFAMVGFPLGIRLHRGGRALAAVGGIVFFVVYNVTQVGLQHVRVLRPWGGGRWVPVILFGLLGGVLLYFTARPVPAAWRRAATRVVALVPTRLSMSGSFFGRGRPRQKRRRRRPNDLVDRYLLRQFLAYLACGLGTATAIFVVVDLIETLSRYRPALAAILEHFAYRVPAALHQALPIVVLAATIFLFMEMGRHHELTALKAAGMSLHRISLPVLVLAGALCAGSFVFQETVLPFLNARGDEVDRVKIRGGRPTAITGGNRLWYRESDAEFLRIDRLDRARRQLNGVTLVEVGPNFRLVKRLDAGSGAWAAGGWELGRSVLREFGPDNTVRSVLSGQTSLSLPGTLEPLGVIQTPPAAMTFMELRAYVRELRERGQHVGTWVLHLHSRLSFPLMIGVLALLAVSCATRWAHGGRLIGAAIAVVVTIAYWVVNAMALSLGRADLLPPIVAAWAANVVFGGIGVALFLRSPT